MAAALVVASGVAWAATISCPNRAGNLCVGTNARDTMTGTNRADDMRAGGGNDTMRALGGNDRLIGGLGSDRIDGASGNDVMVGQSGNDTLLAQDGSDVVNGGFGNDSLNGGATGNDTYVFDDGWGVDNISADASGIDTLDFSAVSSGVFARLVPEAGKSEASSGGGTLNLLPVDMVIENVRGGSNVDTILGNSANNLFLGNAGSDGLYGREGNDTLSGGADRDTLVGEAGDDALIGGEGDDDYQYPSGNWGNDTISDAAAADSDPYTGNRLIFVGPGAGALNINLHSSSAPGAHEVSAGASTINWGGDDEIGNVFTIHNLSNYTGTNDTINANAAANLIVSENGVDTVYALGGDDIIDVADDQPFGYDSSKGGDTVRCGDGNDTVYYDDPPDVPPTDTLPADDVSGPNNNCETKVVVP